jgi:hypothetical protein
MSALKTVLLCLGVSVGSIFATLGVIVTLSGARSREVRMPYAFSEFLAEVEAGHVEEIHVKGRVATFRLRGSRGVERQTIGPLEDREEALNLRPVDPAAPAPKITVEP